MSRLFSTAPQNKVSAAAFAAHKDESLLNPSVSFYFSDSNLPTDKFFFTLTVCNSKGWVPLETICMFKRMSEYQSVGTDFVSAAVQRAVAQEGDESIVVVSDDGKFIRRRLPLGDARGDAWNRSAYVVSYSSSWSVHS
jgi:lupus La protein